VEKIDVTIFKQAFNIIGEGEEAGDKHNVQSKEQADHNLPYIMAVAILDGEVMPRQYEIERIRRDDVQDPLKKVHVQTQVHVSKKVFETLDTYTQRYPDEMPCKIVVKLKDGREIECETTDYEGFFKRPMSREEVAEKFEVLTRDYADSSLQHDIEGAVDSLDNISVAELTRLLGQASAKKV
jgi:2-methylcitrate dehydratase